MRKNSSSSASTPKLVIKPFKVQPKIPDNFEDISWKKLENAIHAVFNKIPTEISKEELYQCVEGLCLHKLSNRLYTNLRVEVEAHIIKIVAHLKLMSSDQQRFLHTVDEVWRDFIEQVNTIRNIFLYLDRTYALVTAGVKSVWDLGLELVAHHLLLHTEIMDRIVRALVFSIDTGRRGQFVDKDLIRRIVRMLIFLGLYSSRFEGPFLQVFAHICPLSCDTIIIVLIVFLPISYLCFYLSSFMFYLFLIYCTIYRCIQDANQFFRIEGQQLAESASPSVFMQRVDSRLQEAAQLVQSCLDPSTKNALLKVHTQNI